ncbi:MAG: DUF2167 domain-containing protein [Pseudomonadota bacterium]
MKITHALLGFVLVLFTFAAQAQRDPGQIIQELQQLAWQRGPGEGAIGSKAKIQIPNGFSFLDERNTRRFLELMGNPPRDGHYMIAPANIDWFAVFSFDPVGYVKDDEKIDAAALLDSLKEGDGPGNEERKRLGMAPIYTDGWHVPPHYDAGSKRLEWGMRLRDDKGGIHVNYTSRLLGRSGVMSAVLVSSPQTLNDDMSAFNGALAGYQFVAGEQYAEFKQGDKIAEYGLAALVVGGAAAAAAKAGLFKSLGKFLWVIIGGALMGGWALLKKFFGRKKEAKPGPPPSPGQQ